MIRTDSEPASSTPANHAAARTSGREDAEPDSEEDSEAMKFPGSVPTERGRGHCKKPRCPSASCSGAAVSHPSSLWRAPWNLSVWQVRPSVFGNGSGGVNWKNPLRDKDVTASIEVKS